MIQQYYDFNEPAVRSNHILVMLLNSLLIPTSLPPIRYVELCNQAAYSVGRQLGMASPIYVGGFQMRSWFYGPNVKEYFFLTGDNEIDFSKHWSEHEPIKVVSHPKSDISFRLQDGQFTSDESGIAVIELNAGLMAYQLACWRRVHTQVQGEAMGVRHFVMKFILPKLLKSHLNVVFINRLIKYDQGIPPSTNLRPTPLRVPDSTTYVNKIVQEIVERFTDQTARFDEILANIPLPFGTNALEFYRAPDVAETRSTNAFFALRSLSILELLTAFDFEVGSNANGKYVYELGRALRAMRTERWLDSVRGDTTEVLARYNDNVIPRLGLKTT